MKRLAYLTGFGGLLLLIGLIVHQGLPEMLLALDRAGWPLLLLLPAHCVPLLLDAQSWKLLLEPIDPMRRASLWFVFRIACVREAVVRLLPTAGIGGDVVGIRLTRLRLDDTTAVTATVIVEAVMTMVTQCVFCALGIVLLTTSVPDLSQIWTVAIALLFAVPVPIVVFYLLRHGAVFERLGRIVEKLLGADHRFAKQLDGARLDADVHRLFAQPVRLLQALAWQLSGYMIGSFETWFALLLLGHRVDPGTALAIEALTQAVRHAAFFVPGGLGVQEASVMLFGHIAGIDGQVALSFALVKRIREILFGVPVLLAWQWFEVRALGRSRRLATTEIA